MSLQRDTHLRRFTLTRVLFQHRSQVCYTNTRAVLHWHVRGSTFCTVTANELFHRDTHLRRFETHSSLLSTRSFFSIYSDARLGRLTNIWTLYILTRLNQTIDGRNTINELLIFIAHHGSYSNVGHSHKGQQRFTNCEQ